MSRAVAVIACALAAFAVLSSRGGNGVLAAQEERTRALAFPRGELVDLSHLFNRETIYWPTAKRFRLTEVAEGETEGGWYYSAYNLEGAEHGGTHLDAPIHFSRGGRSPDEIPLEDLTGAGVVVDVTRAAAADRDHLVSVAELEAWEREHGRLARDTIVLLHTGWDSRWPDAERYLGTARQSTGVEVVDRVAGLVVARVVGDPGDAAVDRGLLRRLDALGAREQAARGHPGRDGRAVVGAPGELRGLRGQAARREVAREQRLDLTRAGRPRGGRRADRERRDTESRWAPTTTACVASPAAVRAMTFFVVRSRSASVLVVNRTVTGPAWVAR
jgi:kynurenine formamidase